MAISLGGHIRVKISSRQQAADFIRMIADDVESEKINSFQGIIGIDNIDGKVEVCIPAGYIKVLSLLEKGIYVPQKKDESDERVNQAIEFCKD
jgi:hypothetical protein